MKMALISVHGREGLTNTRSVSGPRRRPGLGWHPKFTNVENGCWLAASLALSGAWEEAEDVPFCCTKNVARARACIYVHAVVRLVGARL